MKMEETSCETVMVISCEKDCGGMSLLGCCKCHQLEHMLSMELMAGG